MFGEIFLLYAFKGSIMFSYPIIQCLIFAVLFFVIFMTDDLIVAR